MNEQYNNDASIKVRASQNVKRMNGQFIGAFAPYGYKKQRIIKICWCRILCSKCDARDICQEAGRYERFGDCKNTEQEWSAFTIGMQGKMR